LPPRDGRWCSSGLVLAPPVNPPSPGSGEVFGGTDRGSAEYENQNDDDEQEAAHAAANPDATGKNR